jgi:hypothetical protein
MNRSDEAAEFERWLDRELPRAISTELGASGPPPPLTVPSRSVARRGIAVLGHRAAVALVVVALAVAGGGAALTTGSPNPMSLGHKVVHAFSVGALVLQRAPAPTPHRTPSARPDRQAAGNTDEPQPTAGDTGAAAAGRDNGNQDGAKQGHSDGTPSPNPNRPPKDHGHQQGQNNQP